MGSTSSTAYGGSFPTVDDPLRTTDHAPAPLPGTPTNPVATEARVAPEMGNASPSLDGKATAQRIPNGVALARETDQEDFPAGVADSQGAVWVASF